MLFCTSSTKRLRFWPPSLRTRDFCTSGNAVPPRPAASAPHFLLGDRRHGQSSGEGILGRDGRALGFPNIVRTTHNSSYPAVSMASFTNTGKGKSDSLQGCQFSFLVPLHAFRWSPLFPSIWVRNNLRPFFKSYDFTIWNLTLMRPLRNTFKAISLWIHKYGAKTRIKQYGLSFYD